MKSYDEVCQNAVAATEIRFLEHFKLNGGEVWEIGTGCQSCRHKMEDTSSLKKCSKCNEALFCSKACLLNGWSDHKGGCLVIQTMKNITGEENDETIDNCMKLLGWRSSLISTKDPIAIGVAKSLKMDENNLPGWFFNQDFDSFNKSQRKQLFQASLSLYVMLKDEESWVRDKESFPRSSYTFLPGFDAVSHSRAANMNAFLKMNGHLLIFSAWLQCPQPPAVQSTPLEERDFFGILDSLLQIKEVREGVDLFMNGVMKH